MTSIKLSWPPASLSGHGNGSWRSKSSVIKSHRQDAFLRANKLRLAIDGTGDIHTRVTFYPPDRRSDRLNYPNRMKPYFDGIADGLGVNDKRFCIPEYVVMEPSKKPYVLVEFLGDNALKNQKNNIKENNATGERNSNSAQPVTDTLTKAQGGQ